MPRFATGGDGSQRRVTARLYLMGGVFALCFGLLASRAVLFHLKENARLQQVAMRQYRTAVQESTRRGKILDALGRDLAVNVEAPSVWADPRAIENPAEVSQLFAELLGADQEKLMRRLTSSRKFVWVKRWVSEAQAEQVRELGIKGVTIMMENKRSYPNGMLAAQVLGAVGLDSEALSGVELSLNEYLVQRFVPGSYKRDARGHLYLSPTDIVAMQPPNAIELTIDKTIQYIAEQELKRTMESTKAKGGVIIVVDTHDGDVLAMANYPSFDPNEYGRYGFSRWKNRAITDTYEPGSTFKVVSVASALEAGTVTPTEVFDCEKGEITIGRHTLHDSHPHENLSVHDIIQVSSNIGAYKVEKTLGPERTYESMRRFGFGEQTGIQLPGESSGILTPPKLWSKVQFATIAFGQGISTTPLQMAMAFAAIANGGDLLKPHVVKRIYNARGEIDWEAEREVRSRPISKETARTMTKMMESVVGEGGTGTLAASLEYPVAGKTGTAQKAGGRSGYLKGKYYSSFIGFAPADNPRIVVYVGVDEPQGFYYGGQVAAPAFREVMEKTLHYLKVPSRRRLIVSGPEDLEGEAHAQTALPPTPATPPKVVRSGEGNWLVPDFSGLTMRGVMKAVRKAPIELRLVGSGIAVHQSPQPGSVIADGGECVVEFRSML